MNLYPQWWRERFLLFELLLAIAIAIALFVWAEVGSGAEILSAIVRQNRAQIYGTMASISGSLLGFVITAMSIVLGFTSSEKLAILKASKYYSQLWAVFTSTIRWLGITTIVWLVTLLLDRDAHPRPLLLVSCLSLTVLASFRLIRCFWILERMVEVLTR